MESKKKTVKLSEQALWTAFKRGDRNAFDTLYNQYVRLLYTYGRTITNNAGLVEDCIQEVFITLLTKREGLKETDSIKFYLFKALNRRITEALSRTRLVVTMLPPGGDAYTFSLWWTEMAREEDSMQADKLEACMAELTDRQRQIIFLRFYCELRFTEIAQMLGLSMKGTYKLLGRAIGGLREQLR
ncbi:RNA polymerase, sigma-24 subunit, ECF subfamily [Hymenobacter roseosalivarius DSM 11622]|uniref:RNA polymerase, sigma-24 subunit, ECF subfamily n=1 Tax=Hymenobacter roseosalivarius DSM 11622 TaxID=645990 RepID=A0A1W1UH75_9BACT|nr:sigma-70 family RNA polymerase sigma factor [Hymenobacter roseosalivarius]SMB80161.1 RNA polymerase, sigma-24 subunit, ECF subfamily [Hymenobacter roseosalivarius DSM 11622]